MTIHENQAKKTNNCIKALKICSTDTRVRVEEIIRQECAKGDTTGVLTTVSADHTGQTFINICSYISTPPGYQNRKVYFNLQSN